MRVEIPAEFQSFAEEQVKAGAVASAEEAVAHALRAYLADFLEVRALIDEGLACLERGEVVDGEAFMQELLQESKALAKTE